jgi:hypothetical protein
MYVPVGSRKRRTISALSPPSSPEELKEPTVSRMSLSQTIDENIAYPDLKHAVVRKLAAEGLDSYGVGQTQKVTRRKNQLSFLEREFNKTYRENLTCVDIGEDDPVLGDPGAVYFKDTPMGTPVTSSLIAYRRPPADEVMKVEDYVVPFNVAQVINAEPGKPLTVGKYFAYRYDHERLRWRIAGVPSPATVSRDQLLSVFSKLTVDSNYIPDYPSKEIAFYLCNPLPSPPRGYPAPRVNDSDSEEEGQPQDRAYQGEAAGGEGEGDEGDEGEVGEEGLVQAIEPEEEVESEEEIESDEEDVFACGNCNRLYSDIPDYAPNKFCDGQGCKGHMCMPCYNKNRHSFPQGMVYCKECLVAHVANLSTTSRARRSSTTS